MEQHYGAGLNSLVVEGAWNAQDMRRRPAGVGSQLTYDTSHYALNTLHPGGHVLHLFAFPARPTRRSSLLALVAHCPAAPLAEHRWLAKQPVAMEAPAAGHDDGWRELKAANRLQCSFPRRVCFPYIYVGPNGVRVGQVVASARLTSPTSRHPEIGVQALIRNQQCCLGCLVDVIEAPIGSDDALISPKFDSAYLDEVVAIDAGKEMCEELPSL